MWEGTAAAAGYVLVAAAVALSLIRVTAFRPGGRARRSARTGGPCAMTAGISVDLGSPTPPYEQIRLQIGALIAAGGPPAGTRLPAVRRLAADLGLPPEPSPERTRNSSSPG